MVDADADREFLQAFRELPAKQAEVEIKQADLSQAQARLQQLQQMLLDAQHAASVHVGQQSQQEQAGLAEEAAASADGAASVRVELMATIELCEQLCDKLGAELGVLQALVARWQQLVQQHKQLAVLYRFEKHNVLTGVLQQLQSAL
jgi:hypothetical protein